MKKFLALLLALAMVFSLCACGAKSEEPAPEVPAPVAEEPQAPVETEVNDWPDLSGETIKIFTTDTWVAGLSIADVLPRFKQIEERTGCTIEWETVASDYETILQTRLFGNAEDAPDVIMLSQGSPDMGSLAKYIDEGILYDFNNAFDACPNIANLFNTYRTDLKGAYTYSDGGIYCLFANVWRSIDDQKANVAANGDNALWYRADIAQELGFDSYPTTIDELHDLLAAVHEAYPDMVPMHMWDWSCWESVRILDSAWGLHFNNDSSGSFFYGDADGKVQYEPALQATKEWLTEMNKWYEEGLVVVGASEEQKIGAAAAGTTFSGFYSGVTNSCEAALKEIDPDAYFLYMPFPTVDGYETTIAPRNSYYNIFGIVDNGDADHCLAVAKFLDYAYYSDYGIASEKAGVQGEGWDFDENGKFVPNDDYVKAVTEGSEVLQASGANIHFNGPSMYSAEVNLAWKAAQTAVKEANGIVDPMNDEQKANWLEINAFNTSCYFTLFPKFFMTPDDTDTLAALSNDLGTFTNEMLEKYILGTADLENFDTEFVQALYDQFNLQQVLDIYQKYYDAYLANQ